MEEKDIKTQNPTEPTDIDSEEADANFLRDLLKSASAPAEEGDPESEHPPTKPSAPAKEGEGDPPAKDADPPGQEEPSKPEEQPPTEQPTEKRYTDAELQEAIREAVRKASQEAADAVIKRERARQESAVAKLRDLEAVFGVSLDTIVAQGRESKVREAMETFAMDEETARQYVATREENARLKALEQQRQFEHQVQTLRNTFIQDKLKFMADAQSDPDIKKLAQKYDAEIVAFAEEALANGQQLSYDVARDYVLGRHQKEILAELRAEAEKLKAAAQQKTLKDVQNRAKVAPETAAPNAPQSGGLDRGDKAFLKKLGLDDKAIAEIEAERFRKKTKR